MTPNARSLLIADKSSLMTISILTSMTLQLVFCIFVVIAFIILWKVLFRNLLLSQALQRISCALEPSLSGIEICTAPLPAAVATLGCAEEAREPLLRRSAEEERDLCGDPGTQFNRFRNYTAQAIKSFTNDFAEENEIGRGGSGTVFRGKLECGKEIAVKKLNSSQQWSRSVLYAEVAAINRTSHKHVVSLLGCCWESQCLVYEYIPNGTLSAHLRRYGNQRNCKSLSWEVRKKIVVQCAHALVYLHHFCDPSIVHRDVKSGNILLDGNYDAKVADFGLARLVERTHVVTAPGGTFGYISPRHIFNNEVTTKSDVYSFGVVILELVTGMPALLPQNDGVCHLVSLVLDCLENKHTLDFVDSSPEDPIDVIEISNMIMAAMGCVNKEAEKRPTMMQVLQLLEHGIRFPSYILQEYDLRVVSELSNPRSTLCKSINRSAKSDVAFFNPRAQFGSEVTIPLDSDFVNRAPSQSQAREQSQQDHDTPPCGNKSNAPVDAYSRLSSLTSSGIGSNNEGIGLEQATAELFHPALYLDINDPIFGGSKSMKSYDPHHPLLKKPKQGFLVSEPMYHNPVSAHKPSNHHMYSVQDNQEQLCDIASIQDWNQASN